MDGQPTPLCWSTGQDPSLRCGSQEHECFQPDVNAEAVVIDEDGEPKHLQNRPKDQGEELIEVNLANEVSKVKMFLSVLVYSLSFSRHFFISPERVQRRFCLDLCCNAWTLFTTRHAST